MRVALQPEHYIVHGMYGAGLRCAIVYGVYAEDVYGWCTGLRVGRHRSSFFKLARFYSLSDTMFYATCESDLGGGWRYNYAWSRSELRRPVLIGDEYSAQLAGLRDGFERAWLWNSGAADVLQDAVDCIAAESAVRDVQVRNCMLAQFAKEGANWIHESPGVDRLVVYYLTEHWPLGYRLTD